MKHELWITHAVAALAASLNAAADANVSEPDAGADPLKLAPVTFAYQPASHEPPAAAADDSVELANKLANPVASLISVPFQFNYDEGYGSADAGRLTLNIQPVIPFSISTDWNLIVRTIVPVIYQDAVAAGADSEFGLGDTVQSFFFSPKEPIGGWILAVAPNAPVCSFEK